MLLIFFSLIVIILYLITIIISNHNNYRFAPLWFVFLLYFFKPFFSRLIAYYDNVSSFVVFDLFSTVCAMLFPITLIYYYYFFHKKIAYNYSINKISKYFIIFSLIYFFQIFNPNTNLGQGFLAMKNIIFSLFSFVMATLILSLNYDYQKLINKFIIFGLVYISYGIYQAYFGLTPYDLADYILQKGELGSIYALQRSFFDGSTRPFGFALTNGHFYYSIVLLLLFLIPQIKLMRNSQRLMMNLFILLSFILFFKAPERTPIAMFFIGCGFIYFIGSNSSRYYKIFISFSFIVAIFLGVRTIVLPILEMGGLSLYWFRVFELFDLFNAETLITRADSGGNWLTAIKQIMDKPFLGYGAGTGTYTRLSTQASSYSTHNDFLTIFMELGLIGFLIFSAIIYKVYKKIRFIVKLNDFRKSIALGIGAALLAQLACSMFNIALLSGESSRLVWFMVGILPPILNSQVKFNY